MEERMIITYQAPDGEASIEAMLEDDTVWLSQALIVDLLGSSKANISEYIKNILIYKKLEEQGTGRKIRTVQQEGKRKVSRELEQYNLDVFLSIGYRVNSKSGTHFHLCKCLGYEL